MEGIALLLQRMTVALETIAEKLGEKHTEPRKRTELPWNRVSVRCRRRLRGAVQANVYGDYSGRDWPLCCEDLMELGFDWLVNQAAIRNWGRKSAEELVPLMAELGFADWTST